MNTEQFGIYLRSCGYNFWSGVPCSYLTPIINWAIKNTQYVSAVNEGDAVATCTGAYLGGAKPVVLMQNSGLTNALSPLTSLTSLYQIPLLGFVSLRTDEPQHLLMGTITEKLLDLINIQWAYLSEDLINARKQIDDADNIIKSGKSFFFVVKKGIFESTATPEHIQITHQKIKITSKRHKDQLPVRRKVLEGLCKNRHESVAFMSTTGFTSRELYEIDDNEANFYMLGSLGCVSPCALGLSLIQSRKKVIAIDGDGSLLMRLGTMAATAGYAPANMLHILLDNGVHESTGCQPTVSGNTDFAHIAADCGYRRSVYAHNIDELLENCQHWIESPALTFIHIKTAIGTPVNLSRPAFLPPDITKRFRDFIIKTGVGHEPK